MLKSMRNLHTKSSVIAKKYVYARPFEGMPKKDDYKIIEEKLPELKIGEYLAEAVYLSVDPYMRGHAATIPIGSTMIGSQVAKIIDSKSNKFPIGKYVVGSFGWKTHSVVHEDYKNPRGWDHPMLVPFGNELPLSLALGVLGMPGNTAYFGFLDLCQPKSGDTVTVTAAAGAVGSTVGQIAKIKGCTVIGIAGSDKKNDWLKSIGFDHVINYKTQDILKTLKDVAPQKIDCYFDNVAGEISSTVLQHMNLYGRIACCGTIVHYNDKEFPKVTMVQRYMINNYLTMRGFRVPLYADRWNEGILQNLKWIQEGKLQYKETITEGFENMVEALVGVLRGDSIGKGVVKV